MAHKGGGYTSRAGLNVRPGVSDQVQINIDPGHRFDFDQEVEGMRGHVSRLKEMAMAIDEERKQQGQLLNIMEFDMERARATLRSARKRLNVVYHRARSNHMLFLVLFVVALVLGVYVLARVYRLGRAITG